jgi:hypothetical protein
LYSLGYVGDADYERLRELRGQRNAAVHPSGRQPPGPADIEPDPADIEYALDIISRMLNGQYVPGD